MDDELTAGIAKNLNQAFVKVKLLHGYIEPRRLSLPGIDLLLEGNGFHELSDPTTLAPQILDVYVSRWTGGAERDPTATRKQTLYLMRSKKRVASRDMRGFPEWIWCASIHLTYRRI
jgi:hypothetical protein